MMKRHYKIIIEEDDEDGTITFALEMPDSAGLDYEDLSDMLVQVAQTIYEKTQPLESTALH
jgi:phenylacetate-coenzyme A ligase PaaK-like adenylate-forming protein